MNSPSRKGPHEFMPSRWSSEASAALDELKKTTKALQEISSNVKCLVLPAAPLPSAQGAFWHSLHTHTFACAEELPFHPL